MAWLEIQHPGPKWRHGLRPDNTVLIMARFYNTANQTGDTNAVTAHHGRLRFAVRVHNRGLHRRGVFITKIEDMTDFDTTR